MMYHFKITNNENSIEARCIEIPSIKTTQISKEKTKQDISLLLKLMLNSHIAIELAHKRELPKPSCCSFLDDNDVYLIPVGPELQKKIITIWKNKVLKNDIRQGE